jgi:hypothetical protein
VRRAIRPPGRTSLAGRLTVEPTLEPELGNRTADVTGRMVTELEKVRRRGAPCARARAVRVPEAEGWGIKFTMLYDEPTTRNGTCSSNQRKRKTARPPHPAKGAVARNFTYRCEICVRAVWKRSHGDHRGSMEWDSYESIFLPTAARITSIPFAAIVPKLSDGRSERRGFPRLQLWHRFERQPRTPHDLPTKALNLSQQLSNRAVS